jgi:hypothetical protein
MFQTIFIDIWYMNLSGNDGIVLKTNRLELIRGEQWVDFGDFFKKNV